MTVWNVVFNLERKLAILSASSQCELPSFGLIISKLCKLLMENFVLQIHNFQLHSFNLKIDLR